MTRRYATVTGQKMNVKWYCCNLSGGVALIVWFTTNGLCVKNNTMMYAARASNNRVIPIEWSWWVTSNNACGPGEQLIVLACDFRSQQCRSFSFQSKQRVLVAILRLPSTTWSSVRGGWILMTCSRGHHLTGRNQMWSTKQRVKRDEINSHCLFYYSF